jgi:hypothetical protein
VTACRRPPRSIFPPEIDRLVQRATDVATTLTGGGVPGPTADGKVVWAELGL